MELLQRLDGWILLFTLGMLVWAVVKDPWFVVRFLLGRETEEVSSVSPDDYVTPNDETPRHTAADTADGGLSGGLSALSALRRQAVLVIILDTDDPAERRACTTKKALIRGLVAAGWGTSEIRQVVTIDNTVASQIIREAREDLGISTERSIGVGRDGRHVRL
jgi:hypothetical protein